MTLVPYLVGTRSASCLGHLWLSVLAWPFSPLPSLTPSLSLPHSSGLSLLLSSSCVSFSVFFSPPTHTPCTLIASFKLKMLIAITVCLSVRGGSAAPQNPGALKFSVHLSILPVVLARSQHGCWGSGLDIHPPLSWSGQFSPKTCLRKYPASLPPASLGLASVAMACRPRGHCPLPHPDPAPGLHSPHTSLPHPRVKASVHSSSLSLLLP